MHDRSKMTQLDARVPIEPRPRGCAVPLTAEQRDFFRGVIAANPEQQRPISVRMCVSATRITGPLNLGLLEGSIASLVRRHESLRTTFRTFEGVTTHHIDPPNEPRLMCVNLSSLPKTEAENEVRRLAREFQDRKIDLSIGPLFEARLFRLAPQEHVLILLADHMISDGMSNVILDKEVWRAYDDAVGDEPASLSAPPVQYADYAVWRERAEASWRMEHEDYWRQRRAAAVPTVIPISSEGNRRPAMGTVAHMSFGSELTDQLRRVAEREQVSLSNVTLAIYATAMSIWCDKEDLIVRYPVHGRHFRPELENVIGFFSSYLYLRIRVDRSQTLQALLADVQEETRLAIAHRNFDIMREFMPACAKTELEFHWRPARLRRRAVPKPHSAQPIQRRPFLIRSPTSNWNFWCIFNETSADICATVQYWEHRLSPNAIEQFGNNMRSIATALIDRPLEQVGRVVSSCGRANV